MISSISLVILMLMFIFVWQPIWTSGFKDFHTISDAIIKLNETAKPTSELAPVMLSEITKMRQSIGNMEANMGVIEKNMGNINTSVSYMGQSISGEMHQMNYEVDSMNDKFTPMGMMPFNW